MRCVRAAVAVLISACTLAACALSGGGAARLSDEAELLLARQQIENLIVDYVYYHDRKDAEAIADMYTEDATFQVADRAPIVGRDAVMQRFRDRPADRFTRHVTTNIHVTFQDRDHAAATRIMIYYAADPDTDRLVTSPRGVTEYAETFVRGTDGKWRFRSRMITPLFGPP